MDNVLPGLLFTIVLIIGSLTLGESGIKSYQNVGVSWTNAINLSEERVASDIRVTCTSTGGSDVDVLVRNDGTTSVSDFSRIDVVAQYSSGAQNHVIWLPYTAPPLQSNSWTILSIADDRIDPGILNTGETALIRMRLDPAVAPSTTNWVQVTTELGVSASFLFPSATWCGAVYLHNNPTPPTGDTTSQTALPFDKLAPTATTLYNYDTDRDSSAGLLIVKGGTGATESDTTKYQDWRTTALSADLTIDGTVTVTLLSGMKDFSLSQAGSVTVFLRDFDGSSYTEIASGTLTDADWQGGSSTWVEKTISIADVDYTIPSGNFLEVKLIVTSSSAADMWFAYDTVSYGSRIALP